MKRVINNVEYAYDIEGSGPPLLLLHGFTGSKRTWAPFIPLWSKRFQTIAVDIIGHGETDSPENVIPYTMPEMAVALKVLLNEHGIQKTNVLGYSMGGRLALYLAMKHPETVDALLLESASPGLAIPMEKDARLRQDGALADEILKNGIHAFVDKWEKVPLFKSQEQLSCSARKQVRNERLSQKAMGLANSLRGMGTGAQPSFWNSLSKCQKQVMLVAGSLDVKFVKIAEEMEKRLPQCKKIIVDGVGHAVHVETPDIFGTIVYDEFSRMIEMKGRL
jgi:2-succinyl-6-hydroxy-2,4-cyclohexadiene-1-carboxylate synthase